MRTGTALLPLHGGTAPRWLFSRMTRLSREIVLAIVQEHGPREVLTRLSDPYWFQAFGCVLGFDWHSSGLTTTTCGALKEGLAGLGREAGVYIAGGKGRASRRTPDDLRAIGNAMGLDTTSHIYASRMSAKVDTTALQDGYQLYHHTFILSADGAWAVVQQGMNGETRYARRYHWLSDSLEDFVCEPHAAVCCNRTGPVVNMVARESRESRDVTAAIARENPDAVVAEVKRLQTLALPGHHEVDVRDIRPEHLRKVLLSTYDRQPEDFESLLGIPGVGPKTVRALALIAELVYGVRASARDPVRFSFAHGGKDGHPFPVDRDVYDGSIRILRQAVTAARIGRTDKVGALKRLHDMYA